MDVVVILSLYLMVTLVMAFDMLQAYLGAGGGALPLLDCGYGGAGLCKAMLSGGLPNIPRSMSHFIRPLVRRMRITPIMKTTPKMKTTSKVNMTLEMKKAKLPFIAFISN